VTKSFFSPSLYFSVRPMPLAGAAHRLGKDVHFYGAETAVGAGHRGRADIGTGLEVSERRRNDRREDRLVGQRNLEIGAVTRLHVESGTVDALDGAAHAHGLLRQRRRRKRCSNREDDKRAS
jgi:hypothetical protein